MAPGRADKTGNLIREQFFERLCVHMAVLRYKVFQTLFAEFLTGRIHRLGNTVSVKYQDVAGLQCEAGFLQCCSKVITFIQAESKARRFDTC